MATPHTTTASSNSSAADKPGAPARSSTAGQPLFGSIPDTDETKLGPDGKPIEDKPKNKVTALKTEAIKPASALGWIAFILVLTLGVGLWFVSKVIALVVLIVLAVLTLLYLGVRAVFRRTATRRRQSNNSRHGPGAGPGRRPGSNRSGRGYRSRGRQHSQSGGGGGLRGGQNGSRRSPFRRADGSRRNPFERADGSKRNPFRQRDGSRSNPFRRQRNGSQGQNNSNGGRHNPTDHNQNRDNTRTRGGPFKRADGTSRFRGHRTPNESSGNNRHNRGGGSHTDSGSSSANGGGKSKRWYAPWRKRSNHGYTDTSHPRSEGGTNTEGRKKHWYKPWSRKRRSATDGDTPSTDTDGDGTNKSRRRWPYIDENGYRRWMPGHKRMDGSDRKSNRRRRGRWTDQANEEFHYDPDGWKSESNPKSKRKHRWYHGPRWSNQTYDGFNTDGTNNEGYQAYRPGNRWEQWKEKHGNGRAKATRMDSPSAQSTSDQPPGQPTSSGEAPSRPALNPSTQSLTRNSHIASRTVMQPATSDGGNTMTTNPGNARDSATGVRSARTHTVSSEHTAASAVRHFVSAERNYAIGQQYLANNDPDLQLAGEQHLRLAAEQMAVFDDRARLTAGHQAAASKDAKEG